MRAGMTSMRGLRTGGILVTGKPNSDESHSVEQAGSISLESQPC